MYIDENGQGRLQQELIDHIFGDLYDDLDLYHDMFQTRCLGEFYAAVMQAADALRQSLEQVGVTVNLEDNTFTDIHLEN